MILILGSVLNLVCLATSHRMWHMWHMHELVNGAISMNGVKFCAFWHMSQSVTSVTYDITHLPLLYSEPTQNLMLFDICDIMCDIWCHMAMTSFLDSPKNLWHFGTSHTMWQVWQMRQESQIVTATSPVTLLGQKSEISNSAIWVLFLWGKVPGTV
jgi:hypothetical protein